MTRQRRIDSQHVFALITMLLEDASAVASRGMSPSGNASDRQLLLRRVHSLILRTDRLLDLVERVDGGA